MALLVLLVLSAFSTIEAVGLRGLERHSPLAANVTSLQKTTLHMNVPNNSDDIFRDSCDEACDSCLAEYAMSCTAVCTKGCQGTYHDCNTELDPAIGCTGAMWSAFPGEETHITREDVRKYKLCSATKGGVSGCPKYESGTHTEKSEEYK
mmetsp:Transcript_19906/g.42470  ORF Transcript_19906/g.42470 Transcript_19906/m.42470 type:complete len:150 (+) Transcript_19906:103-552(+)